MFVILLRNNGKPIWLAVHEISSIEMDVDCAGGSVIYMSNQESWMVQDSPDAVAKACADAIQAWTVKISKVTQEAMMNAE